MNDLPVTGYNAMRKELWDRQGANIACGQKEMYGEKLFHVQKKGFWREINTFFSQFDRKWTWGMLICGICKQLFE